MNKVFKTTLVAFALVGVLQVQAAPLTWTLNDVTFGGGETAYGTFDFDADTQTYSNVSITTTTGSGIFLPGNSYTSGSGTNTFFSTPLTAILIPNPGSIDASILEFELLAPLTNDGGVIGLVTTGGSSIEKFCGDPTCSLGFASIRLIQSGYASAPTVPIPAAVWLFGSGLMALIGFARRKQTV